MLPFEQWRDAIGVGDRREPGYVERLSKLTHLDVPPMPAPPLGGGDANRSERRRWQARIREWRRIEAQAVARLRVIHAAVSK